MDKYVFLLKFYVSLLPKQKIKQKCKRNKIKMWYLSLSLHTNFEYEEHTQKKIIHHDNHSSQKTHIHFLIYHQP